MTARRIVLSMAMLVALTLAVQAQVKDRAEVALQAAIKQELVNGDLAGAIKQYEAIVSTYGKTNRPVAAQALLKKADAYQRQGSAEARKVYEQIVSDYSDQPAALAAARRSLALLAGAALAPTGAGTTQRVCSGCVSDFSGASLSPDGRAILFTGEDRNLVARDIRTGEAQPYTAKPIAESIRARFPVVSPDLRQIAYFSEDIETTTGQLRLMPNQPAAQHRVLVDNPEYRYLNPTAWSPDGKRILVELMHRDDQTWQIAWVSVSDGAIKVLKSLNWRHKTFSSRPALSRDGKYIVYSALVTNPRTATAAPEPPGMRIYVIAADGTSENGIVDTAPYHGYPVWTPDGTHVIFQSSRDTGDGNRLDLWAVPVRTGQVDGVPVLVGRDAGDDKSALLGVTPAGELLRTSVPAAGEQILISELAGTASQPHTRTIAAFLGSGPGCWSPDGKSVAFTKSAGKELVVRSVESGEEHKAYLHGAPSSVITGYAWLPDGAGLLVADQGRQGAVRRVDLRTGAVQVLFPLETGNYLLERSTFQVSSETTALFLATDLAKSLAFISGAGSFLEMMLSQAVIQVDLATGQGRRILGLPNPDVRFRSLAVSPNGRVLALLLRATSANPNEGTTDQVRLATVNVDGSNYRERFGPFTQNQFATDVAWGSDDQILFTMTTADQHARVMRIGALAGQPEFTGLDVLATRRIALDPVGPRVAYSVVPDGASVRELWSVNLSSLSKSATAK